MILPNLRRTFENRKFSRRKQEYLIKASHRFLGIVYPAMLSMGAEIDQRIWATNRAWRELYGMWWNKRVPYKFKRTLFGGAVCGASLTGLTALLLHDRDYLRLQRCLVKKLRALMLGTASWERLDHIRTLSSRQVWKRWRLAPPAYELCVQRHRWYQSIAREPARHALFYVVGLAECTSNRTTHSLRVFVCILRQMVMRSDYWQICRRWLSSLSGPSRLQSLNWSLVTSSVWGLNEWFLSLDLRQFRAAFFTQTVAPCRVELSDDEGDDDLEGESETCIYTLLDEDGWECVNVGRRHERSLHINVTHMGERMENQSEWQA